MRLICTLTDQKKASILSLALTKQGINNELEFQTNADWGSPDYGLSTFRVWIIDEDHLNQALHIVTEFQKDPEVFTSEIVNKEGDIPSFFLNSSPESSVESQYPNLTEEKQALGPVTLYLVMTCAILLLLSSLSTPVSPDGKTTPSFVMASPFQEKLAYDYPKAFTILETIVKKYGFEAIQKPENLPPEGKELLQEFTQTPYWRGIYPQLIERYKKPNTPWNFSSPMFEKIREGQIWRIFSPIFLHSDLFHLFFNMIWLIVLGKQMEQRLGKFRYILFIAIAAAFSNTAQYLMSGPSFLGFSGVLCAMLAFVWTRQQIATWEGYQLERSTLAFIAFFILFMFTIQLTFFFIEAHRQTPLSVGIANTAHLAGAAIGLLLGRLNFFSWH